MPTSPESSSKQSSKNSTPPPRKHWLLRAIIWLLGLAVAGALALAMVIAVALAMAYPNLPDVSELADYRPKLPLRVYSAEGALIGEFGEERRTLTPIDEIPKVMVDAVLAIEDTRFFEHGGVDYKGMLRAALANLGKVKSQGASTITMQVARNVYLSTEKTYTRKIYEVLLTFKLEHLLSKEKILEIYMNQIFLGHRAYGFAAASEVYFGKPLKDVTIAEAAMLAGLPKAPSAYNPISNPKRARIRQLYIIERMAENGFITAEQARVARDEPLQLRNASHSDRVNADYVAEMARQLVYAQYGDEAYTRGLNVYTTLNASEQEVAYAALRKGIMDYERRQRYRGPEKFIALPNDKEAREDVIDDTLAQHPDNGNVLAAVVLEASAKSLTVQRPDGETLVITGDGLKPVESGLSDKAAPNIKIRQGAVIRVIETAKGKWSATQLPEVEGAFVAVEPRTGAIRALVGGFDFQKNKFNHVTQAWRQPGSSFKPFIFSAALEKGVGPATMVNDAPLFFGSGVTGGQPWEPRNYDNKFEGPMTVRTALAKSRNIPSIRILDFTTPKFTQEWITRFGFDASRHPAYLTMALGAGAVTPMQMATAFSVFANGGYRINPWLISKITDHKGRILSEYVPKPLEQQQRAIEPRNAFVMNSMLQTVAKSGTAARAQATLKRPDLYGKTGTTNDAVDAWFAGFQPTLAAITWIGYDNPRNLGSRETGGGLSLPIWISFMQHALKDVPVATYPVPEGVVNMGGEWFFDEFTGGSAVTSIGMDSSFNPAEPTEAPPPEERSRILDLFRN
ncbi:MULTISPECIES: penicillin-binding protein 1A [Comamonas]|uniref:Penicillin-binding protein 1A n=1 Tax=Comamonas avium TaxID=2762231 RepID=A0ABR8SE96_9BURK|nr:MULTISPECIES: penicillin-binding protein 1A [Comamonas]MBD7961806.1 penicillin-binding protein 1A [Comamonas avium]MBD9403612.1 penicillin-binding protein 1A [Comamonas sp. CMM02]